MPEDTFSEEESFRCQPGREKGFWNVEVHQASGIGTWIRNTHGSLAGKRLQTACLLAFGDMLPYLLN
jgi:hypothetical protein